MSMVSDTKDPMSLPEIHSLEVAKLPGRVEGVSSRISKKVFNKEVIPSMYRAILILPHAIREFFSAKNSFLET